MNTIESIRKIRLQMLIDEFGGQKKLAQKAGVSPAQISQWINSAPDSKTGKPRYVGNESARKLESACGKNRGWFDQPIEGNTEAITIQKSGCPMISWVQAGAWQETIDNYQPGSADEWYQCPVPHGKSTFVLKVRGESMFNPNGRPSFADGDLIFVDPDRRAEHGSLVVVKLESSSEATFKRLVIDEGRMLLQSLNPSWPERIIPINEKAVICGVVILKSEII